MKEKLAEVEGLLKQTEAQRQELERQNLLTNQALSVALVAASKVSRSPDGNNRLIFIRVLSDPISSLF